FRAESPSRFSLLFAHDLRAKPWHLPRGKIGYPLFRIMRYDEQAYGRQDEDMNGYKARFRLTRMLGPAFALALLAWCGAARAESIVVNGVTRPFSAVLAPGRPAPLVIVLHGNSQTSADMVSRTSWPALARREQFSVVFPDGLNRAWADLRPSDRR